ncbi:MAG TPA: hypothetical protein VHM92_11155 [Allosphingosinicella sp.]|nr:hypothetical protein [Allosphingosinicella sp.]
MKLAFVLLLVALMIVPAAITVRLRLARVRREMAERERESGD